MDTCLLTAKAEEKHFPRGFVVTQGWSSTSNQNPTSCKDEKAAHELGHLEGQLHQFAFEISHFGHQLGHFMAWLTQHGHVPNRWYYPSMEVSHWLSGNGDWLPDVVVRASSWYKI